MVRFAGALGGNVGQLGANESKTPNYAVKAGELIGYTGLPTAFGIDVWVENDDITLTGFVDPATVDQSSGLIKFELGQIQHSSGDTGKPWDGQQYVPHVTTRAGPVVSTVLMQLTGQRQLKMEIFAGKTASQVIGLDAAAELF